MVDLRYTVDLCTHFTRIKNKMRILPCTLLQTIFTFAKKTQFQVQYIKHISQLETRIKKQLLM